MADDIFARLFELFNQPGPINWKLAEEVARHIAGEADAVDPWSAEEIDQLVRLAEFRIEPVAPFPVAPATSVAVVDARQWVSQALQRLSYLGERLTDAFAGISPALPLPQMSSSIAGLQLGGLAGAIASSHPASFASGVPLIPSDQLLFIGPAVDRLLAGGDGHQLRLWVSAHEVAHRALFDVPWLPDHLALLFTAHLGDMVPDPEKMMELLESNPDAIRDPSALASLVERPESTSEVDLKAFLAVTGGYRSLLVDRGVGEMLDPGLAPHLDPIAGAAIPDTSSLVFTGLEFCRQIERRFGSEAIDGIWDGPESLPTFAELTDPVGWAARVLLDNDLGL
ncbi:MAG TPA: zinc-dependent metalloprotease [Acidimicrobiia bacterium]|nr:zinc-dependent metalloprotease [Acidimicrobiia bacterium]